MSVQSIEVARMSTATAAAIPKQPIQATALAGFRITLHDTAEPLANEWQDFEKTAVATLFQSYGWISSWSRHAAAAHGEQPLIVTGRDEQGRLAFILPLAVIRRLKTKLIAWLGQSHAGYGMGVYRADILDRLDAAFLRRLLGHIAEQHGTIAGCLFAKQPVTWEGHANPFAALPHLPHPVAVSAVALQRDYTALYEATFNGKKRSELRRTHAQLVKSATVDIAIAGTAEVRLSAFAAFQAQKTVQLAPLGHVNPFATSAIAAFYRDLLVVDAGAVSPKIGFLRVNGEIAAVDIAVAFQDRFYGLNRSMKAGDLRRYSPGKLVNNALVEHACQLGCTVYDLGPGEASYKDEWNSSAVALFTTNMPLRRAGIPFSVAFAAAAHSKALLKSRTRTWNALQDVRRRLRGLRAAHRPAGAP